MNRVSTVMTSSSRATASPPSSASTQMTSSSATGATTKASDELMKCRLCKESFRLQADSKRRPMALRCLHTFCELCVTKMHDEQVKKQQLQHKKPALAAFWKMQPQQQQQQPLSCPVCKKVTQSMSDVVVNPTVVEMLTIFEAKTSEGRQTTSSAGSTFSHVNVTSTHHGEKEAGNTAQLQHKKNVVKRLAPDEPPSSAAGPIQNGRHSVATLDEKSIGSMMSLISSVNVVSNQHPSPSNTPPLPTSSSSAAATATAAGAASSNPSSMSSSSSVAFTSSSKTVVTTASSAQKTVAPLPAAASRGRSETCSRCGMNPAVVSVACSTQMVAQKLCVGCAKLTQQTREATEESRRPNGDASKYVSESAPANITTSITTADNSPANTTTSITTADNSPAGNGLPTGGQESSVVVKGSEKAVITVGRPAGVTTSNKRSSAIETSRQPWTGAGCPDASTTNSTGHQYVVQSRVDSYGAANHSAHDSSRNGIARENGCGSRNMAPISESNVEQHNVSSPAQHSGRCHVNNSNFTNIPPSTADAALQRQVVRRQHNDVTTDVHCDERSCAAVRYSAPTAADMCPAPPPASLVPPYNPDYDYSGWSAAADPSSFPRDPPYFQQSIPSDPPPSFREKDPNRVNGYLQQYYGNRQTAASNAAVSGQRPSLAFMLPDYAQPPKYEEIMGTEAGPPQSSFASAPPPATTVDVGFIPLSPPPPFSEWPSAPPNMQADNTAADPFLSLRLLRSFGKYSDASSQPGTFRAPGRISIARGDRQRSLSPEAGCRIAVSDRVQGVVQVFGEAGDCLARVKVEGVGGCCVWPESRRLIAGTERGVEVFDVNGSLLECVPIGPVITVVQHGAGFIAVQSTSMSIFKGLNCPTLVRTLTAKVDPAQRNRLQPFYEIVDVAVNASQDLVVLESTPSGGLVSIMTDEGNVKSTIMPAHMDCGPFQSPVAVSVDSAQNVIISESGSAARILLFAANGRLLRTLYGPGAIRGSRDDVHSASPAGLAVGPDDRLFVAMRGEKLAEIRVFAY